MDRIFSRIVSFNQSGLGGCLIRLILFGVFLATIGLGWLLHGLLVFVAVTLMLLVISWFVFSWWLRRKIVESDCPACNYEFMGFTGRQCTCPNCGESLVVEGGKFKRLSSIGAIDVQIVDVADN